MGKTYQDIIEANGLIKTTPIKGKEYAEVPQRIKAFRSLYPEGSIVTEIVKDENGEVTFKASVVIYDENGNARVIGTGTAREKEGSSFINTGSHVENAETSAVGRALGMCGYGIETSVASFEEVTNASTNNGRREEKRATEKQVEVIRSAYQNGDDLDRLLGHFNVGSIEELSVFEASTIIGKLKGER